MKIRELVAEGKLVILEDTPTVPATVRRLRKRKQPTSPSDAPFYKRRRVISCDTPVFSKFIEEDLSNTGEAIAERNKPLSKETRYQNTLNTLMETRSRLHHLIPRKLDFGEQFEINMDVDMNILTPLSTVYSKVKNETITDNVEYCPQSSETMETDVLAKHCETATLVKHAGEIPVSESVDMKIEYNNNIIPSNISTRSPTPPLQFESQECLKSYPNTKEELLDDFRME